MVVALLDEDGSHFAGFLCGDVCELLQPLGTDLAEVAEKKDKGEFNPACQVSPSLKIKTSFRLTSPWSS